MKNRRRTVYLSGAGGMGNIGAEAITLAVIHAYQQHGSPVRFILSAWRPERMKALLAGLPGDFEIIRQAVPFDAPRKLKESDVFVVCGDVALTESVIRVLPAYWAFKSMWARLFGAKIIFLGIEVEPVRAWWNRLAIQWLLNPVVSRYVLRNGESFRQLRRLNAAPERLLAGCDPTLLIDEPQLKPFPPPEIPRRKGERLIGFGIRDHFREPLRVDFARLRLRRADAAPGELSLPMQRTVRFLAHIADVLVERYRGRIVFIPHHALPEGERVILTDLEVARQVVQCMKHPESATLLPENLHPYAVMNVYRGLDLVLSMRHHSNSFAYRFAVPMVGCAISEKIVAHFRELSMERLLVDPQEPDFVKAEEVLEHAVRNRDSLSDYLRERLAQTQSRMNDALRSTLGGDRGAGRTEERG